jgi:predicted nuclease with TOPRIM domain
MGAELRAEMQQMGTDIRAEMQQMGTDIRAEMQQMGTDIRAEMREGFQQVHGRVEATNSRIDRTNDVLILVGSEVYRTLGNVEELKQRVQALESRAA